MELGLKDKVAIITGGSKGIGRATALTMLEEGAKVTVCARGQESLDQITKEVEAKGAGNRFLAVSADLMNADDIKAAVAACAKKFGGVDILVNNAGSVRMGDFLSLTDEAWLQDWTLKILGYVRMARETMPLMEKRGGGVIVNIAGNGGPVPSATYTIGGVCNISVFSLTKTLAKAGAAKGIRVVGVNPGPILTDRLKWLNPKIVDPEVARGATPMGRVGEAQEVADLITYVASRRASFVTGTNITVDGGSNPGIMG